MKKLILFIRENKSFTIFLILSLLLIILSIIAPFIAPNDPFKTNLNNSLQRPNAEYPLGTDQLGRCLLSRILHGMGNSFKMTFSVIVIVFILGTAIGVISGYFGGKIDTIIMRICDVFLAFPAMVFAIAIAGILGPSLKNTVLALALVTWTKYARVSRSLVMSVKEKDYINSAKMGGARQYQIIFKYILPNIISSLIVLVALDIGSMLLRISSLSFLGLAAQPPLPEWGYMLSEGRNFIQTAPWLMVYPGFALFITVMIFNLLGDSIRDLLDPNKNIK